MSKAVYYLLRNYSGQCINVYENAEAQGGGFHYLDYDHDGVNNWPVDLRKASYRQRDLQRGEQEAVQISPCRVRQLFRQHGIKYVKPFKE